MIRCLLLVLFVGLARGVTRQSKSIEVFPDEVPVTLTNLAIVEPQELDWTITAPENSKVVSFCWIRTFDCRRLTVKFNLGEREREYCGPRKVYLFENSDANVLKLNIKAMNSTSVTFTCDFKATRPYMNADSQEIDSSEHGVYPGPRAPTCKCGWTNKESSRIVGGETTKVNEYPFPVLILAGPHKLKLCGGSIISPYHVLTAAHCTAPFEKTPFHAVVGEHDAGSTTESEYTKMIPVAEIVNHEGYDNITQQNDIAILVLKEKIEYNQYVGPICLPNRMLELEKEYVKVMGWGLTTHCGNDSAELQKADLRVIDLEVCRSMYKIHPFEKSQFCTYSKNRDSCQGDSGGPLVWLDPETNMYTQVGVVSYGRECGSTDPAVSTAVSYYRDWIEGVVKRTVPDAEVCMQ